MSTDNISFNNLSSNITLGLVNDTFTYKEKAKQIDLGKLNTEKSLDSFENRGNLTDILYELYPNYRVTKAFPESVFGDQFGYDMNKKITNCMADFYAGKISQKEVENFFEECYTSMEIYRKQQRQTSGNDIADKQQIVSELYERFAKENARAARVANFNEGKALNVKYGGRNDDGVYYNSDYYYQCEEVREGLRKVVEKMANRLEIPAIDTEEIEKNSDLTVDGGFDFNSGWNFSYRNQVGRASIEDESMVPPKNFKFFYKENSFQNQGSLWAVLNGRETSIQIPFTMSQSGDLKGRIFYLNDLLDDFLQAGDTNDQYKSFLKNIAVFTRSYSMQSGINNVFGNFVSPKS